MCTSNSWVSKPPIEGMLVRAVSADSTSATACAWSSRQSTSTEGLSISSAPRTISLASIHTLEVIREHLLGNSFSECLTHFTREPEMDPHKDSSVLHFFDCVRHAVELDG